MANRFIFQPFRLGRQGGIAVTDDPNRHLRDKVLAVLFTAPGERINNPRFGVGLNRVVFETMDDLTLAAIEYRILQGLRRDLGDELDLQGVDIRQDAPGGQVTLLLTYQRRTDRAIRNLEIAL
ncbi:MAG: GPW/gp25 family protein [Myxococcota bacterium]